MFFHGQEYGIVRALGRSLLIKRLCSEQIFQKGARRDVCERFSWQFMMICMSLAANNQPVEFYAPVFRSDFLFSQTEPK
jgi:hypothetical protein